MVRRSKAPEIFIKDRQAQSQQKRRVGNREPRAGKYGGLRPESGRRCGKIEALDPETGQDLARVGAYQKTYDEDGSGSEWSSRQASPRKGKKPRHCEASRTALKLAFSCDMPCCAGQLCEMESLLHCTSAGYLSRWVHQAHLVWVLERRQHIGNS